MHPALRRSPVRVDVHAHLYPARFADAADRSRAHERLAAFKTYGRLLQGDARLEAGAEGERTIEDRLSDMDAAGIDRTVLSVGALQPYFDDVTAASDAVGVLNEAYGEVVDRHPRRFTAFGCLPLPHVDQACAEVRRLAADPTFAGVSMGCTAGGFTIDDDRFEPLWAELDRASLPVFLHPGVVPGCAAGSEDYALAPSICGAAEIAVAVLRLVARGVTSRHPNVPFIVATTGGSIPLLARRFAAGFRRRDRDAHDETGDPIDRLRELWFDTSIVEEPLVLLCARDVLGADRLVLGTDAPRISSIEAVRYIEDSTHLSDAEKGAILDHQAHAALRHRLS